MSENATRADKAKKVYEALVSEMLFCLSCWGGKDGHSRPSRIVSILAGEFDTRHYFVREDEHGNGRWKCSHCGRERYGRKI